MNASCRTVTLAVLALLASAIMHAVGAADREARTTAWAEALARQAQEVQLRQRRERLRWEYDRRRAGAHARMPNTLYASAPLASTGDLSCPALVDGNVRRIDRHRLAQRDIVDGVSSRLRSVSGKAGVSVFAIGGRKSPLWLSGPGTGNGAGSRLVNESGWIATAGRATSADAGSRHVYLFPSASEPLREGFVRVVNHSPGADEVTIRATDDGGRAFDAVILSIDPHETVHFNSGDLENGNAAKGLSGATGAGQGDWRLEFASDLDIEVLSYIRTADGFLTAMHDVAPADGNVRRIAIFNPGSNRNQVSKLRLVNPGAQTAAVTIRGMDDRGVSGAVEVSLSLDAGAATTITAAQLESGVSGFDGSLGDGSGKWRLEVESEQRVVAMSLLESPTGHLTNLSTVPTAKEDGTHAVPLFPASGDASGREGFLRVINRSDAAGEIRIEADDETDWDYEPLTLSIGAREARHFNSGDLEQGNAGKGLTGSTGSGEGDWRLALTSELDIDVLAYVRTGDGFLTAMHDVAPSAGNVHRVAMFNPGSNRNQASLLRLVNAGDEAAAVTIAGIDGNGAAGESDVALSVPAGGSRTLTAWELEDGADGLDGALGDGAGKWQLTVTADAPVQAMSLLRSPTGHLTNLSTAPRGADGNATEETPEEMFRDSISAIVQSKCVNCHVEGGASGNTRLVFATDDDAEHVTKNLAVFETFLGEVEDGADLILNKIQGVGHGGGIQVAAGTDEFVDMERFLGLLGEDVGPVAVTPATLFDGVEMESARSTLRRAAIVFAGRVPTDAEYESVRIGGMASLRAAIRGLMEGPEFHEFLIRASNDRLLTDRNVAEAIDDFHGNFPNLANKRYQLGAAARDSDAPSDHQALRQWQAGVQYGFARAPLELIAYVVENDRPYTEVVAADYIMANRLAAEAYGAATTFESVDDVHEFKPSDIAAYYRKGDGYVEDGVAGIGNRVVDPGPLLTDYPHAGVLNTTVFLLRYPTTPTNRNRARSRWTYYHFLGVDIEKSASRTTDPVALADTNNPTMGNPARTVCHSVMDPVAGAFQNYGDEGLYRDKWGGMDSLDEFYKFNPSGGSSFAVGERSREEAMLSLGTVRLFSDGVNELGLKNVRTFEGDTKLHLGLGTVFVHALDGGVVQRFETRDVANDAQCGEPIDEGYILWDCGELLILPLDVPVDGEYRVEIEAWVLEEGAKATTLQAWMPGPFYRSGDVWYRDMRNPGFGGETAPDPDNSLQWLARRIVDDERYAEAAVRFWWPAIMGSDLAEPPEDASDADFDGLLLASNAQSAEVTGLADGFRRGYRGGAPYILKDLLVEMVLSRWFRAQSLADDEPIRATALRDAGARRLLTPEELAQKTAALTGFRWGRRQPQTRSEPHKERWSLLTDAIDGYRLLYGGIDSDGVTERARDITSTMAGVAQSHAAQTSCPVVLKEFYLLPDEDRRLFAGVEVATSPIFEFGGKFEIEAGSREEKQKVTLGGSLSAGSAVVRLSFPNDYADDDGDRNLRLDRLDVRDSAGTVVSHELESLERTSDCNHPVGDHFALHCQGSLEVPIHVATTGSYDIEVVAWADQAGGELARLDVSVGSDTESSAGSAAIKGKLADLYERVLGLEVQHDSPEVLGAYDLFVDVWNRKRDSEHVAFDSWEEGIDCDWAADQRYWDGILEDAFVYREDWGDEWGARYDWDWERINAYMDRVDRSDPEGVGRTWVVVLSYLLMDYRYLFL